MGHLSEIVQVFASQYQSKVENMINGCQLSLKRKYFPLITFTGFKRGNTLSKLGHINFWINSKKYNHIENTHQFFLLALLMTYVYSQ